MNKVYWIVVSTALVLGIPNIGVYAQNNTIAESYVDLKTMACQNLLKLNDRDQEATIMFFHGYITGKNQELTVDTSALGRVSDKVIDHCIYNPDDDLLSVFEKYR